MSHSKKTPTKIIEGSLSRQGRRIRQIRQEVAAEAARIIATEGQHNYRAAKKKAAERLGTSERLALPSNSEVEDALRCYQDLYGGTAHVENLERLRGLAVEAMYYLEKYNPRLVGPVLDGTANQHSRVTLHVFSDSIESVILHFLESGKPFSQEQRQIRWYDGAHRTVPLVVFELMDSVIELMIFDEVQLRQAPPSPIDGKPQRRLTISDAECLLAEALAPSLLAEPALPTG
jgi:hypothetical protein